MMVRISGGRSLYNERVLSLIRCQLLHKRDYCYYLLQQKTFLDGGIEFSYNITAESWQNQLTTISLYEQQCMKFCRAKAELAYQWQK